MSKTKVIFLIFPHIHLMDLAGPDQVFLEAIGYDAPYEIVYCCLENKVKSSALLPFGDLKHYTEITITSKDILILPGSELSYFQSIAFKAEHKLFAWLRDCDAKNVTICSVCSGAFALAQSGILDGKNCTTHWKRTKELQLLYPKTQVIENVLFTEDKNILTSAGIASGIDLALYLIEQRQGEWFAHKVAREMVVYNRRNGHQKQQSELLAFRNHIHAGIHAVQDFLQEHLDKKSSLDDLAEMANMSTRNFTRIFKKETQLTVNEYITILRKEKINQLLPNQDITRAEIARRCGLASERHLQRLMN